MKKIYILMACVLMAIGMTCCSDEDGLWDPIQTTVNGKRCKSDTYKVPASGGEFLINSKNYGALWLNEVQENDVTVWPNKTYDWPNYRYVHLKTDWYEVYVDEKENIVAVFQPKEKGTPKRTLKFALEYCDAFGSICLTQE